MDDVEISNVEGSEELSEAKKIQKGIVEVVNVSAKPKEVTLPKPIEQAVDTRAEYLQTANQDELSEADQIEGMVKGYFKELRVKGDKVGHYINVPEYDLLTAEWKILDALSALKRGGHKKISSGSAIGGGREIMPLGKEEGVPKRKLAHV